LLAAAFLGISFPRSQTATAQAAKSIALLRAARTLALDRKWDDTWLAGIAFLRQKGPHFYALGFSYESSPVEDKHRTFDLPVDEFFKLSAAYGWEGNKKLDFSVGGTLYLVGDAEIDVTAQGVRSAGEFDTNYVLFFGGSARYVF
jgi:long-subunit fatty acid transport protein